MKRKIADGLTAGSSVADLRRYKHPQAHCEITRKDKTWSVFFDGRVAMPGNHFSVSADDQTGETRFFEGE
jgi:hypothetical protein